MAVESVPGNVRRVDFGTGPEAPREVPFWETTSYEMTVRAAFTETQSPGENTDALKSLNFTIGLTLATKPGQTMESFIGMYQTVVRGPQRARISALKGLEFAGELGLAAFPVIQRAINALRSPLD